MRYDGGADTIFNPTGEPLPVTSNLFTELGLEQGHSALSCNSDGHVEGAAMQQEVNLEGDRKFDTCP